MDIRFLTKRNISHVIPNVKFEQNIVIPSNIKTIGAGTFSGNKTIKSVLLNNGLIEIGNKAFSDSNINAIKIPSSVSRIYNLAFNNCINLKKVVFSGSLNKISGGMFKNCVNLNEITLPKGLEKICVYAFSGCKSLKYLSLPDSVQEIEGLAFANSGLEGLVCNKNIIIHPEAFIGTDLKYIYKTQNNIIFSNKLINYMNIALLQDFSMLSNLKDFDIINPLLYQENNDIINFAKVINKRNVIFPFKVVADACREGDNLKSLETFKWYKLLSKTIDYEKLPTNKLIGLYNLGNAIGLFSNPIKETRISKSGKEIVDIVDYGQKSYEFIKLCLEKDILKTNYFSSIFLDVNCDFNPELAKFFINEKNIIDLLNEDAKNNGFISKVFNKFNEVQKYNTSNNAQVRNLAPTIEKFVDYFNMSNFEGVDEENINIAKEIGKYFAEQEEFDLACQIIKDAKETKVPHGILKQNSKECFALYKIKQQIPSLKYNEDKVKNYEDLSDKKYHFYWLDKYDEKNFTLGKYCTCCAHIKGAGFGIMRASILDKNVQNLVFATEDDEIIAKSTLYVNKEEGYGLFNNVEINNKISYRDKFLIYKKFKEATEMFANQYNRENKDNPLKKINVGYDHNDLDLFLNNYAKFETNLLKPINYEEYSLVGKGHYPGDSYSGQYIIWENSSENIKEK